MGCIQHMNTIIVCRGGPVSLKGISARSSLFPKAATKTIDGLVRTARTIYQSLCTKRSASFFPSERSKNLSITIPRSSSSSNGESSDQTKTPFGYSRKDVLLIGVGVTLAGIGLKSGLEYVGVDPLQAGNAVQLVLVLGLTIGWISTYIFRVSNKEMTYAQQIRDYETKVMEKRLEGLTEAELEVLLQQVEEEKSRLPSGEQNYWR